MRLDVKVHIDEHGDETHESWVLIRANRVSTTGRRLFDSEIPHQHYIIVEAHRCSRRRDLHHDRLHAVRLPLFRVAMSEAQWGAFVSSFGQGDGVPATLEWLAGEGAVPSAPPESRLDQSQRDVRAKADEVFGVIREAAKEVEQAFEAGGRRALREAIRNLTITLGNAGPNVEFVTKSLTEHVENVVTKARADIEGMALAAMERGELLPPGEQLRLERGDRGRD